VKEFYGRPLAVTSAESQGPSRPRHQTLQTGEQLPLAEKSEMTDRWVLVFPPGRAGKIKKTTEEIILSALL
jgi:hypothetical protein